MFTLLVVLGERPVVFSRSSVEHIIDPVHEILQRFGRILGQLTRIMLNGPDTCAVHRLAASHDLGAADCLDEGVHLACLGDEVLRRRVESDFVGAGLLELELCIARSAEKVFICAVRVLDVASALVVS
jgi:hypothetical protein